MPKLLFLHYWRYLSLLCKLARAAKNAFESFVKRCISAYFLTALVFNKMIQTISSRPYDVHELLALFILALWPSEKNGERSGVDTRLLWLLKRQSTCGAKKQPRKCHCGRQIQIEIWIVYMSLTKAWNCRIQENLTICIPFEPQFVQAGPTPPARQRVGGGGRGEGTSQRGNQRGQETGSAVGGKSDVDVFFLTTMMLMLVIMCGFSRRWCKRWAWARWGWWRTWWSCWRRTSRWGWGQCEEPEEGGAPEEEAEQDAQHCLQHQRWEVVLSPLSPWLIHKNTASQQLTSLTL